jgi:hypothetical protein
MRRASLSYTHQNPTMISSTINSHFGSSNMNASKPNTSVTPYPPTFEFHEHGGLREVTQELSIQTRARSASRATLPTGHAYLQVGHSQQPPKPARYSSARSLSAPLPSGMTPRPASLRPIVWDIHPIERASDAPGGHLRRARPPAPARSNRSVTGGTLAARGGADCHAPQDLVK